MAAERRVGGLAAVLGVCRVPFLTVSALPVLIGSTLPFWLRPVGFVWSTGRFIAALLGVIALHVASNLANEYYDHRTSADVGNPNTSGLSGGSKVLQSGAVSPRTCLSWAIALYVVAAGIGLWLNALLPGNLVLWLGLAGTLIGFFYTAPPLRLSYRGMGEIAVGAAFGVLPVAGAYFVQAHEVTWQVVLASLPISFAVVVVLWVNEIADAASDAAAGKKTLAARIGARAAGRVVNPVLVVLVFASLFAAVFTASLIPLTLVAVLAFGLARTVVADSWNNCDRPPRLVEAQRAALKLHLAFGLVIALSALVAFGN